MCILHCKLSNKLELQVGKNQMRHCLSALYLRNSKYFKKNFQNRTYGNSVSSPIRFFLSNTIFSLELNMFDLRLVSMYIRGSDILQVKFWLGS